MTTTLAKDSRVRVTNILGVTENSGVEPSFQLIGQEGYVHKVINEGWLYVLVPEHKFYSTGSGALMRTSEVELAKEAHHPANEFQRWQETACLHESDGEI